jgi:hypothetical protein
VPHPPGEVRRIVVSALAPGGVSPMLSQAPRVRSRPLVVLPISEIDSPTRYKPIVRASQDRDLSPRGKVQPYPSVARCR